MATVLGTHRIVKRLRDAGFAEAQAETVTDVLRETRELDLPQLAAKADISLLRADLDAMRSDLSRYASKAELAEAKAELIKWMFGIAAGQIGVLLALLQLFPAAHP